MEEKNRVMGNEIKFLRSRVKTIEKLIRCKVCSLLNGVSDMRFDPQGGGARFGPREGGELFDPRVGNEGFDAQVLGDKRDWMEQSPT